MRSRSPSWRGSTIAGLLQIPGVWEPFDTWLDLVAEPLVHPPSPRST